MHFYLYFISKIFILILFGIILLLNPNHTLFDNLKNSKDIIIHTYNKTDINNDNKKDERIKILQKDIYQHQIEKEIKVENINHLLQNQSIENKIKISISYSTDNKYIYPTIVSMISLVINAANNTFYDIYVLHMPDFSENSKHFLNTIKDKYSDRCSIIYINMGNKYKDLQLNYKLSTPAYYRLSLPELLLDVKKIIYLDGDTLVFEDLKELIELDMDGYLIMGFLDSLPNAIKSFGYKNATVICSGVLLMDLDGIRKCGYSEKINDFISKNKNRINQHDQTIINVVFQERIAPIPPKYGLWEAWKNKSQAKSFLKKYKHRLKYNEEEFYNAIKHPAILHFIWPKPFWKLYTSFYNEWWNYAKLTGFYWEIYLKSPIQKI